MIVDDCWWLLMIVDDCLVDCWWLSTDCWWLSSWLSSCLLMIVSTVWRCQVCSAACDEATCCVTRRERRRRRRQRRRRQRRGLAANDLAVPNATPNAFINTEAGWWNRGWQMSQLNITQLLGIDLQQVFEGDVQNPQKGTLTTCRLTIPYHCLCFVDDFSEDIKSGGTRVRICP